MTPTGGEGYATVNAHHTQSRYLLIFHLNNNKNNNLFNSPLSRITQVSMYQKSDDPFLQPHSKLSLAFL